MKFYILPYYYILVFIFIFHGSVFGGRDAFVGDLSLTSAAVHEKVDKEMQQKPAADNEIPHQEGRVYFHRHEDA